MKKIYIFPNSRYRIDTNPYMNDLCTSLSKYIKVPQLGKKPCRSQFIDMFKYIAEIDYIYFNWIENIVFGKFGIVKFLFYFIVVFMLRIRGVKIIYLLHNKRPHESNGISSKLAIYVLKDIIKRSNLLLTHAKDGVGIIKSFVPSAEVKFNHLPFNGIHFVPEDVYKKSNDILIWGTIKPYKGIVEFLNYLNNVNLLEKYSIKIIGKIHGYDYKEELKKYNCKNIIIQDRSIKIEELKTLIRESRLVLFTYRSDTVLSSSALMQTLSYGATILGFANGAFEDLGLERLIYVYNDYESMINLIDDIICEKKIIDKTIIHSFISNNMWGNYSNKLNQLLSEM